MQILVILFFSTTVFCITSDSQKEEKYQEIVKELGLGVKIEIDKHSTEMPEYYTIYVKGSPKFTGNINIHYIPTKDFTTIIKKYEHLLPDNKNDQDDLLKYFNTSNYEDEVRFDKTYSKFDRSTLNGFYEIYSFKSKQLVFSEDPEDIHTVFAVIKGKTEVKKKSEIPRPCITFKEWYNYFADCKNYILKYPIADGIIEVAAAETHKKLLKILEDKYKNILKGIL